MAQPNLSFFYDTDTNQFIGAVPAPTQIIYALKSATFFAKTPVCGFKI